MCGLCDIGGMQAVVIGHVGMVVIFQCHHVGDKCVHGDSKGLQQIPFLYNMMDQ